MCEVMERYEKEAITRSNINSIKFVVKTFGATKEQVLGNKDYFEEEYLAAIKGLTEESTVLS